MRSLLDVNVLIALMDSNHSSHRRAMAWLGDHGADGWASCPITQNGCIRIISHPGYPNTQSVRNIALRLQTATRDAVHEFWADDVSLLDDRVIDTRRVHGPRQLTDVYLLALAVQHGGRFVTFDASIALAAARNASPAHLLVL